jgi:Ca2+-binding EF-hand superfamily protein
MTFSSTTTTLLLSAGLLLAASTTEAFTTPAFTTRQASVPPTTSFFPKHGRAAAATVLFNQADDRDNEISRLQNMAAKLRAEAAALEADQRQVMADAAERAFAKFDTNADGDVSITELKAGLEKAFKMELPQKRVEQLLEEFDASGDGVLQVEEMVTLDQFKNKLDALAREEKSLAREEAKKAEAEKRNAQLIQASLEVINDREPSSSDKIVSVLPYLFPLLDGLQFAMPLVLAHQDNIFAQLTAILYGAYRSIPLGGFLCFFALNVLSGNPSINRQIRFNMQQAIYLDIALFIPALLGALVQLVGSQTGAQFPPILGEYGSDALLAAMVLSVTYASVSSLLGVTPDKIPLISEAVERRMPTFEIMDDQGNFLSREERDKRREDSKKDE